jgi:hypothetical protein
MAFVSHFWSGKHHRTVKGINLVTLYYTDTQGKHQPVNFRVVDKTEGKTKNDYFLDMFAEVLSWGLESDFVTGDSWYGCVKNLKQKSNRLVSVEKGTWVQVRQLEIPEEGLIVWLKNFGYVKLFRTKLKDQLRHYTSALPDDDQTKSFGRKAFTEQHDRHWKIEQYHRAIKQVCNIERFQVRSKGANAILYENGEEFTFKDICPEQGSMTEISAVEFTRKRSIVVRAVVYWGRKYNDPIYLVTNFPTGGEAFTGIAKDILNVII